MEMQLEGGWNQGDHGGNNPVEGKLQEKKATITRKKIGEWSRGDGIQSTSGEVGLGQKHRQFIYYKKEGREFIDTNTGGIGRFSGQITQIFSQIASLLLREVKRSATESEEGGEGVGSLRRREM